MIKWNYILNKKQLMKTEREVYLPDTHFLLYERYGYEGIDN